MTEEKNTAEVRPVPGKPFTRLGEYDLAETG
jgi:hypothetical protein